VTITIAGLSTTVYTNVAIDETHAASLLGEEPKDLTFPVGTSHTIRRGYLFSAASGGNLFATGKFTARFPKTTDYNFKATYETPYE